MIRGDARSGVHRLQRMAHNEQSAGGFVALVLDDPATTIELGPINLRALHPLIWSHVTLYGTFSIDLAQRLAGVVIPVTRSHRTFAAVTTVSASTLSSTSSGSLPAFDELAKGDLTRPPLTPLCAPPDRKHNRPSQRHTDRIAPRSLLAARANSVSPARIVMMCGSITCG